MTFLLCTHNEKLLMSTILRFSLLIMTFISLPKTKSPLVYMEKRPTWR